MLRPSRPLTIALLWLAIALLPLRGWAATAMPMPMPMPMAAMSGGSVVMQAADDAHTNASAPCHGESHATDTNAAPTCSLCDVCHSAFASLPSMASALPLLPPARPASALVPAVEPAVRAGPERPPRIDLA